MCYFIFTVVDKIEYRCMTAYSSLSWKCWNRLIMSRYLWLALFRWVRFFDQLFHMSWVTEYLVISYATGVSELHFRSVKQNCTCELKWKSQQYVGYDKTRFSVISAHTKSAGHSLPFISKERKIFTSSVTLVWAVTHLA